MQSSDTPCFMCVPLSSSSLGEAPLSRIPYPLFSCACHLLCPPTFAGSSPSNSIPFLSLQFSLQNAAHCYLSLGDASRMRTRFYFSWMPYRSAVQSSSFLT